MKAVVKYVSPSGEVLWHAYGPMVKDPNKATQFINENVARLAALDILGRGTRGFWPSEIKHFELAEKMYKGWEFEVIPMNKLNSRTAGTMGKEIVGVDIDELIMSLNAAYCDEWLAYHQYWIGAKLVKGLMRPSVQSELEQHAKDEEEHAGLLAERIIQLGGIPAMSPDLWMKFGVCGFSSPDDPNVMAVLRQNIMGEQCAISYYNELLKEVSGKDEVTAKIIRGILSDEVEHEEDLQMLEDDLGVDLSI